MASSGFKLKPISYLFVLPFVIISLVYMSFENIWPFHPNNKEINRRITHLQVQNKNLSDSILSYKEAPKTVAFIDFCHYPTKSVKYPEATREYTRARNVLSQLANGEDVSFGQCDYQFVKSWYGDYRDTAEVTWNDINVEISKIRLDSINTNVIFFSGHGKGADENS